MEGIGFPNSSNEGDVGSGAISVEYLVSMGFSETASRRAVAKHGNDANAAMSYILGGEAEMDNTFLDTPDQERFDIPDSSEKEVGDHDLPPYDVNGGSGLPSAQATHLTMASHTQYGADDKRLHNSPATAAYSVVPSQSSTFQNSHHITDLTHDSNDQSSSSHSISPYRESPYQGQQLMIGPPTEREDTELQKAVAASLDERSNANSDKHLQVSGIGGGPLGLGGIGGIGQSQAHHGSAALEEEEQLNKAMEASMASLDSAEGWKNGIDDPTVAIRALRKPEDRVRDPSNSPVILRSVSAHLSGFVAYIQCLHAVASFRNAVLSFRPTEADLGSYRSYAGYWEGQGVFTARVILEEPLRRILALQRLFTLMEESKRSFVHISEVIEVLGVSETDFRFGNTWLSNLRSIHEAIVLDLISCEERRLTDLLSRNELLAEDLPTILMAYKKQFTVMGREVENNQFIDAPLPAIDDADLATTSVLSLDVFSDLEEPDTLSAALDRIFVTQPTGDDTNEHFSLLKTIPSTLVFQLSRSSSNPVTSLDSFGSGNGSGMKKPFRFEEELWLDRYMLHNRAKIADGRKQIASLSETLSSCRTSRQCLALTKDGKDALELLQTTMKYFEDAVSEGTSQRRAKQEQLAKHYRTVRTKVAEKIKEFDDRIILIEEEIRKVFDTDQMHNVGPYKLCGLIMRNGLNGRGSSWSVVREGGKWWRLNDLSKEEILFKNVLEDTTGLYMDAGVSFMFYQHESLAAIPSSLPPFLQNEVLADNLDFSNELPSSIVQKWNLPLYSPLPISSHLEDTPNDNFGTLLSGSQSNSSAHVADLMSFRDVDSISLLTSEPEVDGGSRISPVSSPECEIGTEQLLAPAAASVTENASKTDIENGGVIRLRGGSTTETEEVDFEDDFDEDEVELGILQPMPHPIQDWNIDLAVGKVGGMPVWLDPASPLSPNDVSCGTCASTMSLLIQINSPDDTRPHAAARSLYVFACKTQGCIATNPTTAIKVWRIQMMSPNDFYPHSEESIGRRRAKEIALDPKTQLASPTLSNLQPWPEYDIACEPEPYEETFQVNAALGEGTTEVDDSPDSVEPDTATGVDAPFLVFQDRIRRLPEQVVRFYRIPTVENPEPLWVSGVQISPEDVPLCPLCSSPRKIEFQILSTLLHYLKDDSLQFDSLLIYTCETNCAIPPRTAPPNGIEASGWAEEFVAAQCFAMQGASFGPK